MSDQDSSCSTSASQTEEELEMDGEVNGEVNGEVEGEQEEDIDRSSERSAAPSLSSFSSSLRAVIRIKQKYQAMKKRRQELALGLGGAGNPTGAAPRTSPKIFTFDGLTPIAYSTLAAAPQRKKRRRRKRVLFPNSGGCRAPPRQEQSRAKYCLYLLFAIVFMQVYNAIENLDDHVLRYDLEGLEKTLRREVFGQQGAVEGLLSHLKDYLSTYVHNKPLVVSLHGPSGVGKSHLGRLLAGHFRSVVGETLVLQYYVLHHCPQEANALHCASDLSAIISEMVERAEEEEKIPLFIFDEAEHMHDEILDVLSQLVASKQSNEYLNAIYLFLSNLGHAHITKHMLHNSSSISMGMSASGRHSNLVKELTPILRNTLEKLHILWTEADILPLGLLEKGHVMECFLDEMTREGFYPDHTNIERLAGEIEYYPAVGGHEYSQTGCKQVVAKVNLL
ncbi:Torsin-4A Torsin family 4 member A [Collichthys lucidus]|uniref:Torsin-4A Torsin family 4 member A n=1 Tax=Collichthys lucidus TaxID=240159 RepID=A0A4U5VAG9_COLLU|nr:Torsin-4A Torsin family 4 member A [Collichthys lucidus]